MADYVNVGSGGILMDDSAIIALHTTVIGTGSTKIRGFGKKIFVAGSLSPNGFILCKGAWLPSIITAQVPNINQVCGLNS